jgi:hypothetical protein
MEYNTFLATEENNTRMNGYKKYIVLIFVGMSIIAIVMIGIGFYGKRDTTNGNEIRNITRDIGNEIEIRNNIRSRDGNVTLVTCGDGFCDYGSYHRCLDGMCVSCGGNKQIMCSNSTCKDFYMVVVDGFCTECGGNGQIMCNNSICSDKNYIISKGKCRDTTVPTGLKVIVWFLIIGLGSLILFMVCCVFVQCCCCLYHCCGGEVPSYSSGRV